jgi:hypothetical protein
VRVAARLEFSLLAGRAFTDEQVREIKSARHRASSKKR